MKFLALVFTLAFSFGLFLTLNVQTVTAAPCTAAQPSEGLAGIDILTFKRSIVPCGRTCDDTRTSSPYDETQNCTLCHLLIMVKNIFDLMFAWIIIIALLMLTISGVVYLLSAGNPGTASFAKGVITKTLMGFAGFILAWMFVYTILVFLSANTAGTIGIGAGSNWYEFTCEITSDFD